jgi:hypothetical protein
MRKLLLLLGFVFLLICPILSAQQTLDNDAVIKLAKAGLSDDLLITTINASPGHYDVSPDGQLALRKANLSDKVVEAIVLKAFAMVPNTAKTPPKVTTDLRPAKVSPDRRPEKVSNDRPFNPLPEYPATGPNGLPPGIENVGVYYRNQSGHWIQIPPETVTFQSAARLADIASAGIVRSDLNGKIDGPHARVTAQLPVIFAVYLPVNVAITEFALLELHPTQNERTFLSAEGGFLHTQAKAQRDQIEFLPEKLAPRLYQITLPTDEGNGEFGLLAPGIKRTSNKEVTALIYTVSVTE